MTKLSWAADRSRRGSISRATIEREDAALKRFRGMKTSVLKFIATKADTSAQDRERITTVLLERS